MEQQWSASDSSQRADTLACDTTIPERESDLLTLAALKTAAPGAQLQGQALVVSSEIASDRSGNPYLKLTLRGADACLVEACWWRYPYPADQRPAAGQVYRFTARLDAYQGERQLQVIEAQLVPDADLSAFAHATRRSLAELQQALAALIMSLDPELAALVHAVLTGEVYERFCHWPAAQRRHGAVRHGLLAHSLLVAEIAKGMMAAYGPAGLPCDRGLTIAACLLHDVGKIYTLPPIAGAALPKEARQLDHITWGVLMVRTAAAQAQPPLAPNRLAGLLHAILAHHGCREWGSAIEPQTVEAHLAHLADLAESRLWPWTAEAGR